MKIRVTTTFNDRQNGCVTRPVNEAFECSHKRARELMSLGYAEGIKTNSLMASLQNQKQQKSICAINFTNAFLLL